MVEELLEAGLQAKAFQDGLWEARLGRSSTEIAGLCKALGIKKLSLFGSVLRDDFRPDSDVDILAEFFPGTIKSFLDRGRIQMQLQRSLGRRVDLAEPRLLDNPIRRAEILRTAREIYAAR
jgi:predicted nucleotidyltransferase